MERYNAIQVFQELRISAPEGKDAQQFRTEFKYTILQSLHAPWGHDIEAEKRVFGPIREEEVIGFSREGSDDLPAALLMLWVDGPGYRVSNIVPREVSSLGMGRYNKILADFVSAILAPLRKSIDFQENVSKAAESPLDWLDESAARALATFSVAANKSTGSAHPKDGERWDDFLVLAHLSAKVSGKRLTVENLERWLTEAERWPEEQAADLAIQYEQSMDLLKRYDEYL